MRRTEHVEGGKYVEYEVEEEDEYYRVSVTHFKQYLIFRSVIEYEEAFVESWGDVAEALEACHEDIFGKQDQFEKTVDRLSKNL